jgi:hypothetical protein
MPPGDDWTRSGVSVRSGGVSTGSGRRALCMMLPACLTRRGSVRGLDRADRRKCAELTDDELVQVLGVAAGNGGVQICGSAHRGHERGLARRDPLRRRAGQTQYFRILHKVRNVASWVPESPKLGCARTRCDSSHQRPSVVCVLIHSGCGLHCDVPYSRNLLVSYRHTVAGGTPVGTRRSHPSKPPPYAYPGIRAALGAARRIAPPLESAPAPGGSLYGGDSGLGAHAPPINARTEAGRCLASQSNGSAYCSTSDGL